MQKKCWYKYINDWEKFTETLNMEDITDLDCPYAKTACKDFKIKNLGKEHEVMHYC